MKDEITAELELTFDMCKYVSAVLSISEVLDHSSRWVSVMPKPNITWDVARGIYVNIETDHQIISVSADYDVDRWFFDKHLSDTKMLALQAIAQNLGYDFQQDETDHIYET